MQRDTASLFLDSLYSALTPRGIGQNRGLLPSRQDLAFFLETGDDFKRQFAGLKPKKSRQFGHKPAAKSQSCRSQTGVVATAQNGLVLRPGSSLRDSERSRRIEGLTLHSSADESGKRQSKITRQRAELCSYFKLEDYLHEKVLLCLLKYKCIFLIYYAEL